MEKTGLDGTPFFKKLIVLLVCGAAGAFVAVAILAVFAALIVGTGSYSALASLAVYTAAVAGGFISGLIAAVNLCGRGIFIGATAAVVCILILSLIALIPGAEVKSGIIPAVACAAGGIAGGILGANIPKK
jgi:putative membrane protein (TIGR04086 family)